MLQVAKVLRQPYTATFTLGTTAGIRRVLAKSVAANAAPAVPAAAAPAVAAVASQAPADAMGSEFAKIVTTLPAGKVTRIAPIITKTAAGTATSSAILAAGVNLQTQPEATSYKWDFGDGQSLTTQSPNATHDYFPAIQAGKVAHSFHVTCTIVHDNVTVKRTLVLYSAYGLCRQLGVVVPPVTGTDYATFQHVAFSASLIVHNLESSPITLNAMACVPLSDQTAVAPPPPQFTAMKVPVVIAAKSASALGVYIPLSQLQLNGAAVNGFTVLYSGTMKASNGTSVPVRFSYAFRIPLSDSGLTKMAQSPQNMPINWDLGAALQAVSSVATRPAGAVSKAGSQVVDPATNTVAISLSANVQDLATLIQVRSAVQAGLTSIALKTGAITASGATLRLPAPTALKVPIAPITPVAPKVPAAMKFDPLSPPAVAAGNDCYPADISDADAATASAQQLVCKLTNVTENETIPSSFQNAQAGDVILSPVPVGGGDLIAAMFSALTPPQHHGHSGIMTANFFEITHCTASVDRISKNVNKDVVGIPTGLPGDMLQYAWPGSLTQSIDDATTSVNFNDPSGTTYSMNSFNTDLEGDAFEIIPPLAVKPLPENEAAVRPLLRKAADTARS